MHEFKRQFPPPPPDWTRPRLVDIADRVTARNAERNPNVLTISAEFGLISQREFFSRRVASESVNGYFLLEQGDFAYNKSYSRGYPLGAIRRLDRYQNGCVSPLYICFRPRADAVNSDFLRHYLDGGAIDAGLAEVAKEGVRNHGLLNVGVSDFFSLEVPLPPVAEQRVVAEVLNTLDATIRQTEAIIEKLKQVKQGLLQDILTRGIGTNGELRPPKSEAPHLYKESTLGWIPVSWQVCRLSAACSLIRDGTHLPPVRVESGPLLLSVRNMKDGQLVTTDQDTHVAESFYLQMHKSWKIEKGDVLLAIVGATIGKLALVGDLPRFTLQRSVAVLRGADTVIRNPFLFSGMSHQRFQDGLWARVNQTAQPGIYLEQLGEMELAVPPIAEQDAAIASLAALDGRLEIEHALLRKLGLQKSGLMDDLLTGRVRVTPLLQGHVA